MLLQAPESKPWRQGFYICSALLVAGYFFYTAREYTHGGSWAGIASGVLGVVAIVFLMFFGIIKRRYQSALGNLQTWLHLHIYLGLFTLLLIVFHSGLRFHDFLAVTAFILLVIVIGSGFVGTLLYTKVPPNLVYVEAYRSVAELSDEINQTTRTMRRLAAKRSAAFQRLCNYLIDGEQPYGNARWRILFTYHPRRRRPGEEASLRTMKAAVDPAERDDMAVLLEQSAELKRLHELLIDKQRYVNIMAAWLYLHVPVSFALLLVMAAHVAAALHFRFW